MSDSLRCPACARGEAGYYTTFHRDQSRCAHWQWAHCRVHSVFSSSSGKILAMLTACGDVWLIARYRILRDEVTFRVNEADACDDLWLLRAGHFLTSHPENGGTGRLTALPLQDAILRVNGELRISRTRDRKPAQGYLRDGSHVPVA